MVENNCELFGYFGFAVQLGLGVLSFGILIIKREFEWPKRSWRIWTLDISKQGISSLMVHFINLFFAVLLSKENADDACVWYLINILLDSTIGVIFEWILIRLLEVFARKYEIDTLISGCYYTRRTFEYGDFNINYWIWFVQTFTWCLISSLMKVFLYLVSIWFALDLEKLGNFLLFELENYPKLELIVVMVIVPFILNCFQFWMVDSFLKESDESRIIRMAKGQKLLAQVKWDDYVNSVVKKKSTLSVVDKIKSNNLNNVDKDLNDKSNNLNEGLNP